MAQVPDYNPYRDKERMCEASWELHPEWTDEDFEREWALFEELLKRREMN